jgi:hypothetical protein
MAGAKHCQYCASGTNHPLFLYLAYDSRLPIRNISKKQHIHMGSSSYPFMAIKCENRQQGYRPGCKITKTVAPNWVVYLCICIQTQRRKYKDLYKNLKDVTYDNVMNLFASIAREQHAVIATSDARIFYV